MMIEDDDEIILDEELQAYIEKGDFSGLKFAHSYLPYSYMRARQLLRDEFGIDMITRQGYKIDRYRGHRTYKLVWINTGEVINYCISLYQIRWFLAGYRFPLYDNSPKSLKDSYKSLRNEKAEKFLQIVNSISPEKQK